MLAGDQHRGAAARQIPHLRYQRCRRPRLFANRRKSHRLYSDSRYLVDAINKNWLGSWKKRGWRKADKQPVKNADLWRRLEAVAEAHDVTWKWVRGHAGNPNNERCDELATGAAEAPDLLPDTGYEEAVA